MPNTTTIEQTIAAMTPKGIETMKAIGNRQLSFFDNGVVEGSGIWGECLVSEMGHKSSGVINRLRDLGLLDRTHNEDGDGGWWDLTALGADVANALADEPATEEPAMPITLTTASGRTFTLPDALDVERVAGLDAEGRIVVDDFDARSAGPFMFGLTLCCNASDKGCEDGVFCRACYGSAPNADAGNYLFRRPDGSFPGLDPLATEEPATEEPATEEPATEEPATEEPATEEPATEEPATEEPATEAITKNQAFALAKQARSGLSQVDGIIKTGDARQLRMALETTILNAQLLLDDLNGKGVRGL